MEDDHGFRCADSDNRACCHKSGRHRFRGRGRLRFLAAKRLDIWTASFLVTTLLTSVTGFVFFPIERFTPALGIGVISLIVLAVAILGRYRYHLAGRWRAAYVISSVTAFYFNVFVLVAQLFQKVPALKDLAPTQSEPPFVVAQLVVLVACVTIGIVGTIRFRPEPGSTAASLAGSPRR